MLAFALTSCTSTSNGPDSAITQLSAVTGNSSILAETLQSAADQSQADKTAKKTQAEVKSEKKTESPQTVAAATQTIAQTAGENAKQTAKIETKEEEAPAQQAALAEPTKPTSLFSLFGSKPGDTAVASAETKATEQAAPPPAEKPVTSAQSSETPPAETVAQPATPVVNAIPSAATQTAPQVTSLFGSTKTAFTAPQKPTETQGSIERLFSENNAERGKKLAVVRAKPKSTQEYNYTLPGVRANGGFEIRQRRSIDDDSDIDANEYDDFPSVQLASAPGLARLAPNGLRVQRETVDVACLKPELVRMLKSMERHYRKPVMVTSGYRSPSYNKKVNGARKSLHMICAAADIQIDGVSKWELARFARSMPGRGGVGTYCHTKSIHVDTGPDRDWNWRCRK